MTESCSLCRFYLPLTKLTGVCRRYPKQPETWGAGDGAVNPMWDYPPVDEPEVEWCGDYRARKAPDEI